MLSSTVVLLALLASPRGLYATRPYPSCVAPAARPAAAGRSVSMACPASCNVSWVTKAPVPSRILGRIGLEGAEAAVIGNKIYVGHGHAQGTDEGEMRIYDIATDTWTWGAVSMIGRSEGVGAAVGGKLYAFGGRNLPMCEEYDPVLDTWTNKAWMPTRRKGMAVGVINDRVYVAGGDGGMGPNSGVPVNVNEMYDPATDTWITKAPMPTALSDIYAAAVIGQKMYVFGGWTGSSIVNTTHVYDAMTDAWSTAAPMPTARSNAVAGVLCGQVFVIGGLDTVGGANLTLVEVYDPVTDSWCTGPSKPTGVAEGSTTGISTATNIYVIGSGTAGNSLAAHESLELSSCLLARLEPVALLQGAKSAGGASFTWQPDPDAAGYHLNTVRTKQELNDPQAKLPPVGGATGQCDVVPNACSDPDAISDGTLLYYQVFAACGPTGADEGPI